MNELAHPPIRGPLPDVTTARLLLQRFHHADVDALAAVCSIPQSDNPASSTVCTRIGMGLEREVSIPANERRAALTAQLYKARNLEWRPRLPAERGPTRA